MDAMDVMDMMDKEKGHIPPPPLPVESRCGAVV